MSKRAAMALATMLAAAATGVGLAGTTGFAWSPVQVSAPLTWTEEIAAPLPRANGCGPLVAKLKDGGIGAFDAAAGSRTWATDPIDYLGDDSGVVSDCRHVFYIVDGTLKTLTLDNGTPGPEATVGTGYELIDAFDGKALLWNGQTGQLGDFDADWEQFHDYAPTDGALPLGLADKNSVLLLRGEGSGQLITKTDLQSRAGRTIAGPAELGITGAHDRGTRFTLAPDRSRFAYASGTSYSEVSAIDLQSSGALLSFAPQYDSAMRPFAYSTDSTTLFVAEDPIANGTPIQTELIAYSADTATKINTTGRMSSVLTASPLVTSAGLLITEQDGTFRMVTGRGITPGYYDSFLRLVYIGGAVLVLMVLAVAFARSRRRHRLVTKTTTGRSASATDQPTRRHPPNSPQPRKPLASTETAPDLDVPLSNVGPPSKAVPANPGAPDDATAAGGRSRPDTGEMPEEAGSAGVHPLGDAPGWAAVKPVDTELRPRGNRTAGRSGTGADSDIDLPRLPRE